jgi:hypothetical protein
MVQRYALRGLSLLDRAFGDRRGEVLDGFDDAPPMLCLSDELKSLPSRQLDGAFTSFHTTGGP